MDVENVNCKVRVSQCKDMEVLPIEKPLKVYEEITGLDILIEQLHRVFSNDYVNVQDVQRLMLGYKSDPKDWKKYAKFDRYRYTRNLVDKGNGAFNIMILCWGPGHASAIHDHADSHCFMKILRGNLEEVRYDWPEGLEPEILDSIRKKQPQRRRCCSKSDDTLNMADDCHSDSCHNFTADSQDGVCKNGELPYSANDMVEIGRTRLEVNDVSYINDALGLHRMENPSYVDGAVSMHLYCPPFDSCRVFDQRTGRPTEVKVTFWSSFGKRNKAIEINNVADSQ